MMFHRLIDVIASLVFMGSMWQLEIADLNLINGGVPFGYAFTWIIIQNNWAVRDFFMLLMIISFIMVALNKYPEVILILKVKNDGNCEV